MITLIQWFLLPQLLLIQHPVLLYTDQYRTPLFVMDGVRAILELMEAPANKELYHLGGSECINRYEFGQHFARIFGYTQDLIQPATMQNLS